MMKMMNRLEGTSEEVTHTEAPDETESVDGFSGDDEVIHRFGEEERFGTYNTKLSGIVDEFEDELYR